MDTNQRFAYLFTRYFEKKCTPQEKDELFDLLRQAQNDDMLRQLIDDTWKENIPEYLQDEKTAQKILRRILLNRHGTNVDKARTSSGILRPREWRRVMRYAAIFIIITGFAAVLFHHYSRENGSPVAGDLTSSTQALSDSHTDRYIVLPDGSRVLLHKDAHVDYASGFNTGSSRDVYLTGEAYFDIKPGSSPFIVHTGSVKTIVLGTAFNIDARDRNIVVTVTKGKVKVENKAGQYSILRKDEQLRVDSSSNKIEKLTVNAERAIAWKKSYFLFNDVTMKEAAAQLEAYFHVSIIFDNPALENCDVTASFIGHESLDQILQVLARVNNMQYVFNDPVTVRLSGEGCN